MPGLGNAPSRRATPEARTTGARKPPRHRPEREERVALGVELVHQLRQAPPRPTWRDMASASTAWRHEVAYDLLYFRARARRWARRRGLDEGTAAWVAAVVVLSLAVGYLIVHI